MCFDQTKWRFCDYRKHETPVRYRSRTLQEIDRLTFNSISRYYPHHQPQEIEKRVIEGGIYVRSHKPHKLFKLLAFEEEVGACDGQPSKWVKVEVTSNEYHGRPITREQYERFVARQTPCCE